MARDFKDPQIVCYDARGNGDGNTTPTLTVDHQNRVTDYTALAGGNGQLHQTDLGDKAGALNCMHDQQAVCYRKSFKSPKDGKGDKWVESHVSNTLNCFDVGDIRTAEAICTNGKPPRKYIVRRLTPTECARLQGFPDWWTDGVEGSDSARYKMWGNGIALPCAVDVLGRIVRSAEQE